MKIEKTLSIVKPDAMAKNQAGQVLAKLEAADLKIIASKMLWLNKHQAEVFYAVHQGKPFFKSLVAFMTSGPVLVSVLQGENAILKNREVMGATNPAEAAQGTIRAEFAESIERNAIHGSDSPETAEQEISFFFAQKEIY